MSWTPVVPLPEHHSTTPREVILGFPDLPGVERPSREIQDPAGSMPRVIPGNLSLGWNCLGSSLVEEFL